MRRSLEIIVMPIGNSNSDQESSAAWPKDFLPGQLDVLRALPWFARSKENMKCGVSHYLHFFSIEFRRVVASLREIAFPVEKPWESITATNLPSLTTPGLGDSVAAFIC